MQTAVEYPFWDRITPRIVSHLFQHEMLFKMFHFSGFWFILGFLWQPIYFLSWNLFFSVRTVAKIEVKLYCRRNTPTSGSLTAKNSKCFPFTWSDEALELPKLQMKVLFSALKVAISFLLEFLDINDFESDNFEGKNYKIESFANEINLQK